MLRSLVFASMHKMILQKIDILMNVGNQAQVVAERRLYYCGLIIASPSSPEGERSTVDCSDWLFIVSPCVIEVGGLCSSSSGCGEERNGKTKIIPTATAKATANHIHHRAYVLSL
jgi:hypothetical protein